MRGWTLPARTFGSRVRGRESAGRGLGRWGRTDVDGRASDTGLHSRQNGNGGSILRVDVHIHTAAQSRRPIPATNLTYETGDLDVGEGDEVLVECMGIRYIGTVLSRPPSYAGFCRTIERVLETRSVLVVA